MSEEPVQEGEYVQEGIDGQIDQSYEGPAPNIPFYPQQSYGPPMGMPPLIDKALAEFLIEDHEAPLDIKELFWGFLNVNVTLGNLTPEDIRVLIHSIEGMRCTWQMSFRDGQITYKDLMMFDNLSTLFLVKLTRARGGNAAKLLSTQIVEHGVSQPQRSGFSLRRILGR